MLEEIVALLIKNYRCDLQDYQALLQEMRKFDIFWEERFGEENIKKNSTEGSRNPEEIKEKIKKEKSPILLLSRLDEGFENRLKVFTELREELFQRLRERAEESLQIKVLICSATGEEPFQAFRLKPYLNTDRYKELINLTESLAQVMGSILEMDQRIIQRLKDDLELVKSEIHRIEGVKKTRKAYETKAVKEARFIDRTE